jgi:hypothetical protein
LSLSYYGIYIHNIYNIYSLYNTNEYELEWLEAQSYLPWKGEVACATSSTVQGS